MEKEDNEEVGGFEKFRYVKASRVVKSAKKEILSKKGNFSVNVELGKNDFKDLVKKIEEQSKMKIPKSVKNEKDLIHEIYCQSAIK